jgi:hypothetical protein
MLWAVAVFTITDLTVTVASAVAGNALHKHKDRLLRKFDAATCLYTCGLHVQSCGQKRHLSCTT